MDISGLSRGADDRNAQRAAKTVQDATEAGNRQQASGVRKRRKRIELKLAAGCEQPASGEAEDDFCQSWCLVPGA
jgi:hypothetical protein